MAEIKTVKKTAEDPKKGKPREQSQTRFPYYDLADAVKVADAIQNKAGGLCDRDQLAALLGHDSVKSGAFLSRVAGAKMFGLIEQAEGVKLRVTQRGRHIVAPVLPQQTAKAKLDAFFDVELFKKVFEQYKGATLPNAVGLENLFGSTYGIVKNRQAPTVRVMLKSAEYAGLFETAGRSQMVIPVGLHEGGPPPQRDPPGEDDPGGKGGGGGHGGNGGGDDGGPSYDGIDPMVLAFVKKLPPAGATLSGKKMQALVDAFTATVTFIYTQEGED